MSTCVIQVCVCMHWFDIVYAYTDLDVCVCVSVAVCDYKAIHAVYVCELFSCIYMYMYAKYV